MKLRWQITLPDCASHVALSPTGEELGVATLAGPVLVVDAKSGALRRTLEGHAGGALAVAWSPAEPLLATGGIDGRVRFYRGVEAKPFADAEGATIAPPMGAPWTSHVAWAEDGETLAVAAGRTVRLFGKGGQSMAECTDHVSTVSALLAFGEGFLSACYGSVKVLSRGDAAVLREHYFRTSLLSAVPSPDGRFVALGCQDAMVHIWDTKDDDEEINLIGYRARATALAFCPDAPVLATASGPALVIWPFGERGFGAPMEIQAHDKRIVGLAFTHDRRLVSASEDGILRIHSLTGDLSNVREASCGAPVRLLTPISALAVVIATADGRLQAWEV